MLADDILAAPSRDLIGSVWGQAPKLAALIQRAARFEISAGAMESADLIRRMPLEQQFRALAICRFPFRSCWLEFASAERATLRTARDTAATPDKPMPKRMGVLVECDDTLQRGRMTFAWRQPELALPGSIGLNICPLVLDFDWTETPDLPHAPGRDPATVARLLALQHTGRHRDASREAYLDYMNRAVAAISPIADGFWSSLPPAQYQRAWSTYDTDLAGEDDWVRCVLMVLNSRNLAERVPRPAPPKLNRARLKAGRAPLLDFETIRIRLSPALAARAGSPGERDPSRLHVVRGHWKLRRSGLYWWSPHVRGDETRGVKTTMHYAV